MRHAPELDKSCPSQPVKGENDPMSVYRKTGSPYYHFDFQFRGRRYYGSTGCTGKRDAEEFERRERRKATLPEMQRPPISIDEACGLYLPILVKKPGALRNGAPFKDWDLPPGLARVRAKLKSHADGDRQFVKVLGAVLDHGLDAVEAACAEALEAGIASGDVILTVLARQQQPAAPISIVTPAALRLNIEPVADCGRYDSIRMLA